ncbi:endonuclease [filamentous cyanobacterium CCP5]|nr:endonuclease [filamentous cyanobacterium CCP5]
MAGYDPDFLGQPLPLPDFSPGLVGDVLEKLELTNGIYAQYHNYTVVMSRRLRTPLFAALNIDQSRFKSISRSDDWRIDTRIGAEYQLNNDYYNRNPWDRGHLARRAAAAWGDTSREAKHASDDTFFFSNATLQHENFNQDEWLALEEWVQNLTLDSTDRISVICGPIFGETARSLTPSGRPTALIPSAFFKVVAFINQENALEVRAFMMLQDEEALRDKGGRQLFNFQRYQVSVTEIEERTGLRFPPQVPDGNPLFFNENPAAAVELNVQTFPEHIEVDSPEEMIAKGELRETVLDDQVAIFIAAALVNASGDERLGEWVSIINLTNEPVNFEGWKLKDPEDELEISGSLGPGEAMRVGPLLPIQLANRGGTLSLYNPAGARIDRVKYPVQPAILEDKPVVFAMRDMTITG